MGGGCGMLGGHCLLQCSARCGSVRVVLVSVGCRVDRQGCQAELCPVQVRLVYS